MERKPVAQQPTVWGEDEDTYTIQGSCVDTLE